MTMCRKARSEAAHTGFEKYIFTLLSVLSCGSMWSGSIQNYKSMLAGVWQIPVLCFVALIINTVKSSLKTQEKRYRRMHLAGLFWAVNPTKQQKIQYILTWRPLPFEAWRLQRPRLPFGVVPQLLMICSCFSARSARSSSSSMNCCSRTLALASRAAVSWRNWSIWATSLRAERGTAMRHSLNSGVCSLVAFLWVCLIGGQTTHLLNLACGGNLHVQMFVYYTNGPYMTAGHIFLKKNLSHIHTSCSPALFAWRLHTPRYGDRDIYTTQTQREEKREKRNRGWEREREREREKRNRGWGSSWIFIQPQAQQGQVPVILRDSVTQIQRQTNQEFRQC